MEIILSIALVVIGLYLTWGMLNPIKNGNANIASAYEELTKPIPVAASLISNNWVKELEATQSKLKAAAK